MWERQVCFKGMYFLIFRDTIITCKCVEEMQLPEEKVRVFLDVKVM